jgi:hypothetical protein
MMAVMKKIPFLLLLAACAPPLWAGTDVKAHLQSYTDKKAWVDVEAFVGDGHLRLDFQGPWSHGSLLYDRDTSLLTVVDHIHKTVLPLTQDTQAALKIIAAVASAKFEGQADATKNGAKALQLARENAQAFFNGTPNLTGKGVLKRGFTCDDYRTDWEGKRAREVWVADPVKAGMGEEDYNTLRALAHQVLVLCGDELTQWGADTGGIDRDFFTPQLPVEEVLYLKGRPSSLFEILSVGPKDLSAGTFTPPAGYQTMSLADILKQGFQ